MREPAIVSAEDFTWWSVDRCGRTKLHYFRPDVPRAGHCLGVTFTILEVGPEHTSVSLDNGWVDRISNNWWVRWRAWD